MGADEDGDDESKSSSCMGEAGCCLLETTQVLNDEADDVSESGTAETTESGRWNGAGCDEEEEEEGGSQIEAAEKVDDGEEEEVQKPDECRI